MRIINLSSIYSGLKQSEKFQTYRDLWKKTNYYNNLLDFPLHLDIELSGVCNLKCESCFQNSLIQGPLGFMKIDLFRKIIDEGMSKGLSSIKLQVRGESFLHPELFDCIRYAKKSGVMDVQITTNGTLLDDKCIDEVFKSGLDAIIFSIDAHHGESCKNKFGVDTYDQAESSIKELLKLRTKLGKVKPWVRIRVSIPIVDADSIAKTKKYIMDKFPECDIVIVGRIHNFRDDEDSFPDLHTNYIMMPCSYLMQRLTIFWNGDVTTCCMDYNNRFQLGNVQYRSIQDIWLSEKMRRFRKLHSTGRRKKMPICKHCHACTKSASDNTIVDTTSRHIADYNELTTT